MKSNSIIEFRIIQVWELFKLILARLVSFFCAKKDIWIISERGVDARDNGYWLFKYIKEYHPEIDAKFVISRNSSDRQKLVEYETDLVEYKSIRHYVLLWMASHLISTHVQGYAPFVGLGLWIKKIMKAYNAKYHVFLQHGITKDLVPFLYYDNTCVDLLIAGAKPEYDYFLTNYGYSEKIIKYTGFCRFDHLDYTVRPKRQILVMPTWRKWIDGKKKFQHSDFAQTYLHFLTNPELHTLLNNGNVDLVFYLHHEMQPFVDIFTFSDYSSHIIVAKETDYDVQQLLKESALLITDYSSVCFDFAYMIKPVIFYQFDLQEYRKKHYAEGWFDYKHCFGPVVQSEVELIAAIQQIVGCDFSMEEQYKAYVDECFPLRDDQNTQRVFDSINCLSLLNSFQ